MDLPSRRAFLKAAAAAGAAWAAADIAQVEAALAAAHQAATAGQPALTVLTPAQAATLEAMAARIFPAVDGRPGAREIGVLGFIDQALSGYAAGQKTIVLDGARDLEARAAGTPGAPTFAALPAGQQDAILRQIESTPFFETVRMATVIGAFALPSYGGNRNYAGWQVLGLDHQMSFQPPFGYYDAEAHGAR